MMPGLVGRGGGRPTSEGLAFLAHPRRLLGPGPEGGPVVTSGKNERDRTAPTAIVAVLLATARVRTVAGSGARSSWSPSGG